MFQEVSQYLHQAKPLSTTANLKKNTYLWLFIVATVLQLPFNQPALAEPALEDFGQLPSVRSMSMSPSGNLYAWLQELDGEKLMVVYDKTKKSVIGGLNITSDMKTRNVQFASENHVILQASETRKIQGYYGRIEYTGAFVYSIKDKSVRRLLRKTDKIHPAQSGIGKIVGYNPKKKTVFMPAYGVRPTAYNLYKVDLKYGRGKLFGRGSSNTKNWFVNSSGEIIARDDFNAEQGRHTFYSYLTGKPVAVYSYEADLPQLSVQAVSWDEKHLLFIRGNGKEETVRRLSLVDGSISEAMFVRPGHDIDYLETDLNQKLIAVKYSGFLPSYEFKNEAVQASFDEVLKLFPDSAVDLISSSKDDQQFLVRTSGNTDPNTFWSFSIKDNTVRLLTRGYDNLRQDDLGQVNGFKYPARDQLDIPAILTWPVGKNQPEERENLPLIVLPHGGPDSYDAIGFAWLAQFLAYKGYLVLQPNFRGSTGFGYEFHQAGRGRWGKEMQDDISDGVQYLIDKGIANKDKVCIVGSSYGGYAALAGGAFTPELYRCVIAINGIADIRKEILKDIKQKGNGELFTNYWEDVFGEDKQDFDQLNAISPYYFADNFRAPTLIIYSKDDTVVGPEQSKMMHKALKKAGKESELVELKGEDHWMSTSAMRLELLVTIDKYLNLHNPVE